MTVKISNFGDILVSRPAGKESFLQAKAYVFNNLSEKDIIILDFSDVKVLTPSWSDEFISGIKQNYSNKIEYLNTENESVSMSLKTVDNA